MGSQIAVDTAVPFEYYDFEIIQRLSPIKSPLRPVGGIFRSNLFEQAFELIGMFCTDCPSGLQECAGQKTLIVQRQSP